jgi:hypothetical protein
MDTRTLRLLINKGLRPNVLRRVMLERLTEPLHLNPDFHFPGVLHY